MDQTQAQHQFAAATDALALGYGRICIRLAGAYTLLAHLASSELPEALRGRFETLQAGMATVPDGTGAGTIVYTVEALTEAEACAAAMEIRALEQQIRPCCI